MLQEWDERRRNTDRLLRRDVHVLDAVDVRDQEQVLGSGGGPLLGELTFRIERRIRLRHDKAVLLIGGQELHLVGDPGLDRDVAGLRLDQPFDRLAVE